MPLFIFLCLLFFSSINFADYSVDYGDGETTTVTAPPWAAGSHPDIASHKYIADGFYTVTVTADVDCNNDGNADTDKLIDTLRVIVGNVTQQWDYGDGQRTTSSTNPCSQALTAQPHTYNSPGTYTVTYTEKEANGQITTDTIIVTVTSNASGDNLATNFNCIETTATNPTIKQIYTKLAGNSFSLDIVALDNGSIDSNYNKAVNVDIIDPNTGAIIYNNPHFQFKSNDNGRKPLNLLVNNAYSNLICKVTYTPNGQGQSPVSESSDNFSVRPTTFTITSNLTNTSPSGSPKAKAGTLFTLTATAITGYTGTPKINNLNIEAHAGAVQTGTLSGSFNTANSGTGTATGTNFSYSEVGLLRLTTQGIYDDSFSNGSNDIDNGDCTNDFSNTVDENGKVGCKFGNTSTTAYFGRFTPDHFDVTLNTPLFTPGCGTFTYIGQPVKYATVPITTVSAKNASGTTTQNYTGSFWKINPTDGSYGFTPSYSIANHSLTVLESSAPSVADSGNGTGTLTFADTSSNILAVTKSILTLPFDAEIALSFTLSDTDAIVVANVDGSAQLNPVSFGAVSSGNGISFSSKTHRWGRVVLDNAHGSELTPLAIPLTTEYYDGINFIKNTADNCTSFTLANDFSISDAADVNCTFTTQTTPVTIGSGSVKISISNATISSGATDLIISDNTNTTNGPGVGNTGYVDITTKLTNLSWLLYDWDTDNTHDNCPSARATFGIYKGNSKQIYFREVY